MWSFIPYISLRGQGAASWQTNCLASDQSEPLKSNLTQEKFCSQDKLTDSYLTSLFGMTSSPSQSITKVQESISKDSNELEDSSVFVEASLVKDAQPPEKGLGLKTKGLVSGRNLPVSLAKYDQHTSSWKTHPSLLKGDSTLLSAILPKEGILLHTELYPLRTLERPILGNVSGDSQYPTPCSTGKGGSGAAKKGKQINEKFPTPTANTAKNSISEAQLKRNSLDLLNYVNLYPTPCTTGMSNGSGNCQKILKIPHLSDEEKRSMRSGNGGRLNPEWVEWLMGFPIGWTEV